MEKRYLRKNGQKVWVSSSLVLIRDSHNEPLHFVSLIQDISDRKGIEEQLRHSQKLEAVGQLTGGIAHDFNNILNIILGNADLMQLKANKDPEDQESISDIIKAVKRGGSLTQRLLSFSRQQTLKSEPTEICPLVRGLENMLRRSLGEAINIQFVCNEDHWLALIDPHQLENALVNLAVNARDAMKGSGTLTIEINNVTLDEAYASQHDEVTPGDYIMVAVSDTGEGMSNEVLEQAFEPFYTTKGVGEGSGLGLPMVYGFVKQSGGHITIDSEVGRGTTVKLFMRRTRESVKSASTEVDSRELTRGKERILIVEDEDDIRKVTIAILDGQGYKVSEAANGKEALSLLQNGETFDLLFTDVILPGGMNGVEIAEAAKILQPEICILYATGYAEDAIAHGGELKPGVTLLKKPFESATLLEKIRDILDKKRSHTI